ncbi:tetratricopeptide repeat protein [Pseudanabaena sp. UWO311]|uniref:CHAT domain-containing protein n=1 Tax=Pseudanabaena sp. UWO311 TaxID=2487337 RepID=UPI00115B1211|nr:tetratricopeptide repeat protein [Pseudanabaena sp. UWO311]TYQ25710.1 tetratricopeptide repeat protein [Pseudanabaena sp. UWO311]
MMNKEIGIAMLTFLACGQVQIVISESIQAQTTQDRKIEADRILQQGIQQAETSQFESALQSFERALTIYRAIKERKGEASAVGAIGLVYGYLGQQDKAIAYQLQSLELRRKIQDREGEGKSLSNLGNAYQDLGKYDKAIEFYLKSLEIAREIKDRLVEGAVLGNLGTAYNSLGKYDKAIEFQLQSLAIAREIKDRLGEENSLGNLGNAYNSLGKYDKVIEFYLKSLEIAREIKDRLGEGKALGNLGNAYQALGKYDKAIEFFLQSLAIAREIKDRLGEGNSLGKLGIAYDALGKYDKAIEFHLQSLAIAREVKYRRGEGKALNNLAVAYGNLNRDREAMISYQQALSIAREIGNRGSEGLTLANLGNVLSKAKRPELAILFYKQSINVREAIRKDIRKLDKDIQKSYLETVSNSYKRLANLLIQKDRIVEALQVLDLLKVQELEDYLKNIKGSDRSAQGVRLLDQEKAISDKLLAASFENSPEINSQLANKIQQLPKSEINKVPDYLQKIPQGTALLYPLILSDRLEIILFSPNTVPINRTVKISQKELETLVTDFRSALIDTGSEDVKEPAAKLYNILIKPVEAELTQAKTTTILYAPDGQLRYIPLAALYDGKQWLAEKYRINNLIAYSLFDFSPNLKIQPNILAGAFGGKANEKKFGQIGLPATLREVQAIANSFQNSVTLTEDGFSRQAIESKFKNHNILHLATHAEFNTGTPDNSFIIFGNGDKIRLNEITDWQIPNIDLIVLSACQTGVGKLGDGVEILGFGYQIQKAGAKNAIASLWSVNDEGTQALMEAFYNELKKGDVTSTEALHRAQVALIKSQKYNHPNYWSAFFAIGNGL